ncbi:MAG: hypothetical protein AB7O26_03425 [Planctomycetaceae bacterium]
MTIASFRSKSARKPAGPGARFLRAAIGGLLLIFALPGCVILDIGVTNPVPGLSTVAIAPFINLSHERAVDGRRFALAYYTELQKVPGFEVLPVGVTEAVIVDNNLHLNNPDDVLKLARILNVDAVVVGAITDYAPYYPPRIGMQVEWYSPQPIAFYPGIQYEPQTREQFWNWDQEQLKEWRRREQEKYEERAIEDHFWERCWWRFKRLPGIRKLAGEPAWVLYDPEDERIIRAQSEEELPRVMTNQETDLSSRVWRPENARIGWIERAGNATANVPHNVLSVQPITTQRVIEPPQTLTPNQNATELQVPTLTVPSNDRPLTGEGLAPPAAPAAPNAAPTAPSEPAPIRPAPSEQTPAVNPVPPPPPLPLDEVPQAPQELRRDNSAAPLPNAPALDPMSPALGDIPAPILPIRDPKLAPLPPQPNPYNVVQPVQPWQLDPRQPFMSYTRMFDGADADLAASLRDYVELSGDVRSGGWEAYMHRSDDFIKFTSYLMIQEMLSLHGGQGRHRLVFKPRKFRYGPGIYNWY